MSEPSGTVRSEAIDLVLVIPHFDHADALVASLPALVAAGFPVIVVDDGSDPVELRTARDAVMTARERGGRVELIERARNGGKGRAVLDGASAARAAGHTHVLQIDADGQHDIADLPRLMTIAVEWPEAIVSGQPTFDADAPWARVHGRKLTTAMIALETLGGGIEDGLCGYRIYPLSAIDRIGARFRIAERMGFDTDMLVKARWLDIPVRFASTRVRYPANGRSHFHYGRDNLALVGLHLRLLAGALRRAPVLLARRTAGGRAAGPSDR